MANIKNKKQTKEIRRMVVKMDEYKNEINKNDEINISSSEIIFD